MVKRSLIDMKNMTLPQKVRCCVDQFPCLLDDCTECRYLDISDIECIVDYEGVLYIYEIYEDGSLESLLQASREFQKLLSCTKAILICISSTEKISFEFLSHYIEFIEECLQKDAVSIFATSFQKTAIQQTDIKITIVFAHS